MIILLQKFGRQLAVAFEKPESALPSSINPLLLFKNGVFFASGDDDTHAEEEENANRIQVIDSV